MTTSSRLTDATLKGLKAATKPFKKTDGQGLYVLVTTRGARCFRFDYTHLGKSKTLAIGTYPEASLANARIERDKAKELLRQGIDPASQKAEGKRAPSKVEADLALTFKAIADNWLAGMHQSPSNAKGWVLAHHIRQVARLEQHAYPALGQKNITEITPLDVLAVCKAITTREARGRATVETAHRVLTLIKQVFRYAKITGKVASNPADDLAQALPSAEVQHHPAVTTPADLANLLRAIEGYKGSVIVCAALKLAPLVFLRPFELRHAKWADIDLDGKEWRFMVSKTKTNHIVPLARQSIEIFQALQPITGGSVYVFPSLRALDRPMSDNTILAAMRRLGIPKEEMTGHGFRATARTMLDEVLGERIDLVEHQLAHSVRDTNGRAYNRTQHLPERHRMMQRWADYLDALRTGGNVLVFQRAA